MDKQKLIKQLFVGKVSDIIGIEKTTELLKEATDAISAIPEWQTLPLDSVVGRSGQLPLNRTFYNKARTLDFAEFCKWINAKLR